ncbi:hypothetical protein [Campylobacter sp. VTCC 70190]|uniref:hypothetical protein n=1 Tax=Campylobacter sp. VTCC 70190 TaxID=3392118 RepID=UPI00398ED6E1
MKKIFTLLVSSAFAEGFLAKVTRGALSDTSPGVKNSALNRVYKINSNLGSNSIVREMPYRYEQQLKNGMGF